ncbi:MAG TPA: EamA family transporter [Ktedonobacteraceae bacterium]|nr:EamA family transporter [Ktedonobacteraceae bacterium]
MSQSLGTNSARRGFWSIVSAATLWGTTGVTTRAIYNLNSTNALSVAFMRLGIAALVLLLLCVRLLGRRVWLVKGRDRLLMLFLGTMQALFQFCYLAAIPYCGVTIATLIALCIAPVLVVLYSAIFLRERITLKILFALIFALTGTIFLSSNPIEAAIPGHFFEGIVFSLICASGYAGVILSGQVLSRRYHSLQVNMVSFLIGALLLFCASFTTKLVLVYSGISWLLLLYLGCIPTALAYVMFQSGMRSIPATLTSILTLSEPLTAAILAWILFGERLNLLGITGALLLFGTIFLLAKGQGSVSSGV